MRSTWSGLISNSSDVYGLNKEKCLGVASDKVIYYHFVKKKIPRHFSYTFSHSNMTTPGRRRLYKLFYFVSLSPHYKKKISPRYICIGKKKLSEFGVVYGFMLPLGVWEHNPKNK